MIAHLMPFADHSFDRQRIGFHIGSGDIEAGFDIFGFQNVQEILRQSILIPAVDGEMDLPSS